MCFSNIEDRIVELFNKNVSSKLICFKLRITRNILNAVYIKLNLIPQDPNDLYFIHKLIYEKDEKYCIDRLCPECGEIKTYSVHKNKSVATTTLVRAYIVSKKNKITCFVCAKKGQKNSFYGKTHSKKTIDQISKSRNGKGTGKNNSMANPENRKKLSNGLKKAWDSGKHDHLKPLLSQKMKDRIAAGKIKSVTISKDEKLILKILKKDFEVYKQKIVNGKRFDFYLPEHNLLIEYNGDYWHCNPKKYAPDYFNKKKGKYAKELWEYDKLKIKNAKKAGYNCIVIWEAAYKKNPNILFEKIKKHAKS